MQQPQQQQEGEASAAAAPAAAAAVYVRVADAGAAAAAAGECVRMDERSNMDVLTDDSRPTGHPFSHHQRCP